MQLSSRTERGVGGWGCHISSSAIRMGTASWQFKNKPPSPNNPANCEPTLNGIVYVVCKILRNIMASAAEAELGALFLNCQEAVPIQITLEEMWHPQHPTPVQVENSTSLGIETGTIKQRKSKTTNMRFYWIRDRINQYQFNIYWKPGSTNRGDYFKKHPPRAPHNSTPKLFARVKVW